ncbi:MAG: universal stress protein [Cyanobacteriota bacterium]|nr:universal stress protein [Cyanobacteriota bacterium]
MVKHLLIPVDGSVISQGAMRIGLSLAQKLGARVSVFYALPTAPGYAYATVPPFVDRTTLGSQPLETIHTLIAQQAQRYLQGLTAQPQPRDGNGTAVELDWEYTESDHPYRAILKAADQLGCDLIVMASHGRHGLEDVLLGSETQKVLTQSSLPVLVVPPAAALEAA